MEQGFDLQLVVRTYIAHRASDKGRAPEREEGREGNWSVRKSSRRATMPRLSCQTRTAITRAVRGLPSRLRRYWW
jgi:hypothetical protein